jgi:hypothetical protein
LRNALYAFAACEFCRPVKQRRRPSASIMLTPPRADADEDDQQPCGSNARR